MTEATSTYLLQAKNGLLNQTHDGKLEFLRSILGINASILIAVIGLIFILYQIDRYNKFKRINYWYLLVYVLIGVGVGLAGPTVYLHSADPYNDNPLYIVAALSVYILIALSAAYMALALRAMSTARTISRFRYHTRLKLKLERLYAKAHNAAIKTLIKITRNEKKFEDKQKALWRIGLDKNLSPLAKMNQNTCLQHGVVMQEADVAQLSPLSVRVDLLVRMAATAVDADDIKVFRQIIAKYTTLAQKSDEHRQEYAHDIESIADILIRKDRYELYDLMIDDIGRMLVKDEQALAKLDDNNGYLYASLLYRYVEKADDMESVQRAVTRLMNLHFAVLNIDSDMRGSKWLNTPDSCNLYEQKAALKIAEKDQPFSLWLMYEKANYFAHHGAEMKNVWTSITYLKLISNIGIIGRVYDLHCGATDCSKSIYQHAFETFETLGGYCQGQFNKTDSKQYITTYTEAFEKLTGHQIKFDLENHKCTIDKSKTKIMQTVKLGPTIETSDSEAIDFSKLDKITVARLMNSRKSTW